MVLLQRQAPARRHHDALDLEALADVDALVPAPGPVHPPVRVGLRVRARRSTPTSSLTRPDCALEATSTASGVATTTTSSRPDHRGQPLALAVHQAVGGAQDLDPAAHRVAGRVLLAAPARPRPRCRRPTTGTRPAARPPGACAPSPRSRSRSWAPPRRPPRRGARSRGRWRGLQRGPRRRQHLGGMRLELGEHQVGAEQEVAGVPQGAVRDQRARRPPHPASRRSARPRRRPRPAAARPRGGCSRNRSPAASARCRASWCGRRARRPRPRARRAAKAGDVADDVVGGHDQHHRLRVGAGPHAAPPPPRRRPSRALPAPG